MSFRDFSTLGCLAMDYQRGTISLQRGEAGTLFLCTLVPAEPLTQHPIAAKNYQSTHPK